MEKYNEEQETSNIEIMEFTLKTHNSIEKYAMEVLHMNEVYSVKKITKIPCTPSFIIGIMNFRGKVVSVIDVRNFLGFTMEKIDSDAVKKVILIKVNEIEVGIAADSILGCRNILVSDIQKNILNITNSKIHCFKGITKEGSIVLDIKNLMMDEKIIVNEEVI